MTTSLDMVRKLVAEHGPVHVPLVGEDGNAFAIIGRVARELRRADWPLVDISAVRDEMMAGDYDHLLQVAITVTDGAVDPGADDGVDGRPPRHACPACGVSGDHSPNACLYHDDPTGR